MQKSDVTNTRKREKAQFCLGRTNMLFKLRKKFRHPSLSSFKQLGLCPGRFLQTEFYIVDSNIPVLASPVNHRVALLIICDIRATV